MLVAACTKMTMSAAEEERCRELLAKLKEAIDKRGVLLDKLGKVMDETVSSLATSTPLLVCGAADSTPNSTATNKVPAMANAAPSANTTLTDQTPTRCSTMCPDHSIDMPLSDCTTAVVPTSSSTIATLEIGNTFIANTVLVKSTECSKECEEQAVDTDHCVAAAGICAVASTNCLMECPRLVASDIEVSYTNTNVITDTQVDVLPGYAVAGLGHATPLSTGQSDELTCVRPLCEPTVCICYRAGVQLKPPWLPLGSLIKQEVLSPKLLGKYSADIDLALDNMTGRNFCEKVNEYSELMREEQKGMSELGSKVCKERIGHEVQSVKIIRNKLTGIPEGYGFIEFISHEAAEKVLQTYNGTQMPGTEHTLILHGTKTSAMLNSVLADIHHLKRDNAVKYSKKNDNIRPFESSGETFLEFFSLKTDCSLIVYGSHSKKRPNNLVLGRTYDHHIYNLVEVGVENYKSMEPFVYDKKLAPKLGSNHCFAFIGEHFESVEDLKHLKEVLLDPFRGEVVENLNLAGVDRIFVCTAISPTTVYMMHCVLRLKWSGTSIPRMELVEVGPSMDLVVRPRRLPVESLKKEAMKTTDHTKKVKNVTKDPVHGKLRQICVQFGELIYVKISGGKDDDLTSSLMWLRDSADPGFQSLNFGGLGTSPWMQPRLDASLLGLTPDMYQTIAATAFQDPTKQVSPTILQFQQPQNMVGRAAPLLPSQILQQVQPQFQQQQPYLQSINETTIHGQTQSEFLQQQLQRCQSFKEQKPQLQPQQQQQESQQQQQS